MRERDGANQVSEWKERNRIWHKSAEIVFDQQPLGKVIQQLADVILHRIL